MIFADDCSLLSTGTQEQAALMLNRDLIKISAWATKWKITFNAEKTKEIIFAKKINNDTNSILFNNKVIERITTHKHLGLIFTSNLDWTDQVQSVCLRANRKLSVLRRVRYLQRSTLDLLYKTTIRSVIDYGLAVYYQDLKQTDQKKFNKLQYNAAKLVTSTLHYTSQEKLEVELGWETITNRADCLGLSIFHKIYRNETRPLIKTCMPQYNLRKVDEDSNPTYVQFPYHNKKYSKSFFPFYTKQWNRLPRTVKLLQTDEFKKYLKDNLKPKKYKPYFKGDKYKNSLLTRIRVGRSFLNSHRYSTGQTDTPNCSCNDTDIETPMHYITQCELYSDARRTLFGRVEQFIPRFKNLSKKKQFEILVHGYNINEVELNSINVRILNATQFFIHQTKRFL